MKRNFLRSPKSDAGASGLAETDVGCVDLHRQMLGGGC